MGLKSAPERKQDLKSGLVHIALAFILSRAVVYLGFFLAPLFIPESQAAPGAQSDLPSVVRHI